jgi:hypothetical protein
VRELACTVLFLLGISAQGLSRRLECDTRVRIDHTEGTAGTKRSYSHLGRISYGLINEQNGNLVPNWVDAPAFATFQAFPVLLEHQRLFACRTNQDIEQFLGNHGNIILEAVS